MINEYSCGGLVYRFNDQTKEIEYLIIKQVNGRHYGFPKGHMEENETKAETAYREILEETGIKTVIDINKNAVIYYEPKPGIKKEVTYFLAKALTFNITYQHSEITEASWLTKNKVLEILTFQNDLNIFNELNKYLEINH